MSVIINTVDRTVVHAIANVNINIAGNNTVSNVSLVVPVSANTSLAQVVTGASISKIISSGSWTIKRGNTTVWEANGMYTFNFSGHGMPLSIKKDDSLDLSGSGSILVELKKESANSITISS